MSQKLSTAITVIGVDIGKNSFHVMGHVAMSVKCHESDGNAAPRELTRCVKKQNAMPKF